MPLFEPRSGGPGRGPPAAPVARPGDRPRQGYRESTRHPFPEESRTRRLAARSPPAPPGASGVHTFGDTLPHPAPFDAGPSALERDAVTARRAGPTRKEERTKRASAWTSDLRHSRPLARQVPPRPTPVPHQRQSRISRSDREDSQQQLLAQDQGNRILRRLHRPDEVCHRQIPAVANGDPPHVDRLQPSLHAEVVRHAWAPDLGQ